MPELRIDPLSGLRVIVAGERSERPGAWPEVAPRAAVDRESDPFAEGHEDRTPPELAALRPGGGQPDSPGWRVRVVPNLYPALDEGHEVIVSSPEPIDSLLDLGVEQLEAAMGVWRDRMGAHGDAACRHLIVNEGREAGASLPHTHAQLYALPFVPAAVARERERFTAHWQQTQGRNLLEDLVIDELRQAERVVAVDSEAVAICPFASAAPFQVQLIPRRPVARFEDEGPLGAALLHEVLGRMASVLGALPPFNLWVRTAPSGAESFCWRIDLLPRLAQPAGLELGTGVWLNAVAPERAAESLRAAGRDSA